MKVQIEISDKADSDLFAQYDWYLSKANEEVADRFFSSFHQTITLLSRYPLLGRKRNFSDEMLLEIRSFAVSKTFHSHLIFYRFANNKLFIERVVHGARDLENRLVE